MSPSPRQGTIGPGDLVLWVDGDCAGTVPNIDLDDGSDPTGVFDLSGLGALVSFPPPVAQRRPYSIALPTQPPWNYHIPGNSAAEVRTARSSGDLQPLLPRKRGVRLDPAVVHLHHAHGGLPGGGVRHGQRLRRVHGRGQVLGRPVLHLDRRRVRGRARKIGEGVHGAHLNPLGFFLRTSIQFARCILVAT